jgi:hypothetical protein
VRPGETPLAASTARVDDSPNGHTSNGATRARVASERRDALQRRCASRISTRPIHRSLRDRARHERDPPAKRARRDRVVVAGEPIETKPAGLAATVVVGPAAHN